MTDSNYSFVLEDELCEEYGKYLRNQEHDKECIEKLLSYQLKPFLYSPEQAKKVNLPMPAELETQLLGLGVKDQSPLELCEKFTYYHGILSKTQNRYPYININNSKIRPALIGSLKPNDPRDTAKKHLQQLLANATKILVWDKYLLKKVAFDALLEILPSRKKFTLIIDKDIELYLRDRRTDLNYANDYYTWPIAKDEIERKCTKCTIKNDKQIPDNHHDRYIVVDNRMQILLSSGFEYLGQNAKDFTYVISSEVKQFWQDT